MRILAVLYCYPPLLVPAAMCYMKLIAGLRANDVEVEILTIDPDTFDSPGPIPLDPSLLGVAPTGVVQHTVRSPETTWLVRTLKRIDKSRRLTYRWLEPRKHEWTYNGAKLLRSLDLSRYDAVLTCSQPHANHLLGLQVQEAAGLPWIAYFSDPWTENPYASFASETIRQHHRRLEDRVLAAADRVFFTCDEMLELVVANHSGLDRERCGILPHAFIPEWYERESPDPVAFDGVRLLHTGSFYGPRTPVPLIDALRQVASRQSLASLRIDSYGGMERRYRDQIQAAGLSDHFRVQGFIPYLQTLGLMRTYDGLLLVDAPLTSTAESVFLPSKLIDYIGSGTPVVALTPERGATARVVREAGGTVLPLERPAELVEGFARMIETGQIPGSPRREGIDPYGHIPVGRHLARAMQGLLT